MNIDNLINSCEEDNADLFKQIDSVALFNQEKVLKAFQNNKIALRHFSGSSGYGYDDGGREALSNIFAEAFGGEAGIVSPLIASGTHAISSALFGILRPKDVALSICGTLYDTIRPTFSGENIGSLKEFGIDFHKVDLLSNGKFDVDAIQKALAQYKPKMVYIQRSRGYTQRNSFSIDEIKSIISLIKKQNLDSIVFIDNCYGEFIEKLEPTQVGADIIVGSLIKNPGGGLAPTGGYIVGKKNLIELIAYRLTAPGVGMEIGSYAAGYRNFFQGFFMAPHVTAQALKGSILFGAVFNKLGYSTLPKTGERCNDIIRSICFNTENELVKFCQTIQKCSPIDSFVTPYAWDMPGYSDKVIMAAGTFVQGASIELSADSPIKKPYIAYLQGGLTYEHVKIALKQCYISLFK